ncbi:MAG: fibronectin type III-like domain-contianing protein, partial [Clostridia bacterium]|nr:fibronectin type III-like domain-contianing protein [Clostridia bacterium]
VNCYYGQNPANCYIDSVPTPHYPFGYGLSYTRFAYGEPVCENARLSLEALERGERFVICVDVANVGKYDAKEVVQLYIHDPVAKMMRPLRELKAFAKVEIAKGTTAHVTLSLGKEQLGYYLPDGTYTLERGKLEVFVGENCLTERKLEIEIV